MSSHVSSSVLFVYSSPLCAKLFTNFEVSDSTPELGLLPFVLGFPLTGQGNFFDTFPELPFKDHS